MKKLLSIIMILIMPVGMTACGNQADGSYAQDWGITTPYISLSVKSPEGGGFKYKGVSYIGLSSTYNVSLDQEIYPGDVFSGKALYVMVNDDNIEYVFEYSYKNEDDEYVYDYSASR